MANLQETVVPSGQHYSGNNRIPNIKQFIEGLDKDKKLRDAEIDAKMTGKPGGSGSGSGTPKKPAGKDGEVSEHTAYDTSSGKNRRVVTDPVTGNNVEIDDMDSKMLKSVKDPVLSIPNANLDKPTTVKTEASQSGEEYRRNQDITAPPDPVEPGSTSDVPIHGEKTNVLFHPTPSVSYEPMYESLETRGNLLCAGIFLGIIVFGKLFGGRLLGLIPLAVCIVSGIFLWIKDLIRQGRNTEWSSEQKRGETAVVNLIPESVEWLNSALALVWGLINPDMFIGVADTLEDVMQASVPGVVDNVKVNDISQGSNPIRVLSLRALPDSHVKDLKEEIRKANEKTKDEQEILAEEEGGEFYNLEATVAYHSLPSGNDMASKARNMGMQIIFYLGIKGLFGVPFPVWVELNGLICTVRLRVALTPDPPFVKTVSFTLMGLPKVDASCIPLLEKGANVLNLPLISNFVNWAIAAAANMYVAPKSMTLDIGKMLEGDSIQKDTAALGVLFVRINKAVGLSKQDARGSKGGGSDPYICVAFSKFGKPQYCTRVIQDDLNPVFSETTALLVTPDIIRADEQLSLELWDSDRSSADDVVGKVELSIQKLIQHPGKMFPQVSNLRGIKAESSMPGELHWEVGFFGKTQFRRALRTDGSDPFIPKELQGNAELQGEHGVINNEEEDAVVHTPPDPLWPSGILSVVVHQIVGLELENVKGSNGKRKGREYEPARPEAGELKEEQGKKLPSSYCTIIINDELVYKTRTKVVSSKPIFEAGTERFIRDWRSAIATVTVRDSRNRQHDPIIGVVPLKLSDLLLNSSQSTRWYPLDGGIGFGRARISILFRSVDLKLPPTQISFGEVGTFEFLSDSITTAKYAPSSRVKIRMRTGGSSANIGSDKCKRSGSDSLVWDITNVHGHHHGAGSAGVPASTAASTTSGGAGDGAGVVLEDEKSKGSDNVRLPVQYRYRSPVFFELHPSGHRSSKSAYASLWLQDLVDNEETDFDIPIWKCDNPLRLSQNYITEANYKDIPDLGLEEIGRLRFRGRFKPGTDRDHLNFVSDNDSRETIETWEACFAEGVRTEVVHAEVPERVQKMHEESLLQGRDVLASASEEDKKKWLSKDGTDWTGAFGKDPLEYADDDDEDAAASGARGHKRHDTLGSGIVGATGHTPSSDEDSDDYDDDDDDDSTESSRSPTSPKSSRAVSGGTPDLGVNDASSTRAVKEGVIGAVPGDGSSAAGPSSPTHARADSRSLAGASSVSTAPSGSSSAPSMSSPGRKSTSSSLNPITKYKDYKTRSRDLHRRQRGLMQWKPMRNMQFAKDEATFAVRRVLNVGKLSGRSPDVETEV
ncbi:meiotically up-regulated protein [Ophiostoma piceae UAMH 11346]|uniref:Meiotically up-regulated protein n=1 Tax=Ophiostoma piceae (strain UAMH 11346) TaxID=1262450 RepID=S3CMN5_OPHP1|nr:meiotically up-regulated protein [Ophiostoma piceae UAMH 11346]